MSRSSHKELLNLIGDIHRSMRRSHRAISSDLNDVTLLQLHALGIVCDRGFVSMGELGQELGMTKASMTALVRRLVSSGWIVREASREDRRLVHLRLTPQGRASFRKLQKQKVRRFETAIDSLGASEKRQLLSILRDLRERLQNS